MIELKRTETTKTFDLDKDVNGRRRYALDAYIGAIHYRDVAGMWQDINTSFAEVDSGGYALKFTKLPYLVRIASDSSRRIYPDRHDLSYWIDIGKPFPNMGAPVRKGNTFTWDFPRATLKVSLGRGAVKFAAILKDSSAPSTLTIPFSTQGINRQGSDLLHNGRVVAKLRRPYAIDANEAKRDLTVTFNADSITLTLDTSGLTYPIDIDPTIDVSVGASDDDCMVWWVPSASTWAFLLTDNRQPAGWYDTDNTKLGGGMRFQAVNIPSGATIVTATCTLVAAFANAVTTVNSRICGELSANAAAFGTLADYQTRRGTDVGGANNNNRTVAQTNWDSIGAWVAGTSYTSPAFTPVLQEMVDTLGALTDIAIFWDDYADRSSHSTNAWRRGASWDHATYAPPALHIEYTVGGIVRQMMEYHGG